MDENPHESTKPTQPLPTEVSCSIRGDSDLMQRMAALAKEITAIGIPASFTCTPLPQGTGDEIN